MEENALMIGAGAVQVGQDIFAVNVSCVLIIATIFEIYLGFSENSSSACPVVMIVSMLLFQESVTWIVLWRKVAVTMILLSAPVELHMQDILAIPVC